MKKDRYLLPQITDLLENPRKTRFYSKINLRCAYHLIQIHEVNGKLLFALATDLLNDVSCLLDLPMPLLLFSIS